MRAYRFPARGFPGGEAVAKRAYYKSVAIGDGFWSVVVTAPEADALSSIDGFRDRWLFLSLLLTNNRTDRKHRKAKETK